ncbi:MAG: iron-sulfur cluster assembly scaffold protein [bacterium]|nr:iron-sulfur cluster assembly scaffold protein [bacterium]
MVNNVYSEKVIEHFRNPHNYGKIEKPDGIGKVGNVVCGDVMHLYIRVEKEVIKDVKFETLGCAAAISTSSVVTDLAKGKTIKQALKIDNNAVVKSLGGLPLIKIHCSLLAIDALQEAIYDYLSKNKKPIPEKLKKAYKRAQKSLKN